MLECEGGREEDPASKAPMELSRFGFKFKTDTFLKDKIDRKLASLHQRMDRLDQLEDRRRYRQGIH